MAWPEYEAVVLGSARIMDESSLTEGDTAYLILNFWMNETGYLESRFRIMPLIPGQWNPLLTNTKTAESPPQVPAAFAGGVLAMKFAYFDGGSRPEILFITTTGIFRYAPWLRSYSSSSGNNGLEEIKYYPFQGSAKSIIPQAERRYPPQIEQVGNRLYFTFGDGGGSWVWDGARLRPFGYSTSPSPPDVRGPAAGGSNHGQGNSGGFSASGRIGDVDPGIYDPSTLDGDHNPTSIGAILEGEWEYAQVWENQDGAYSPTSINGGQATIRRDFCTTANSLERYKRKFLVKNLNVGPEGTVARIILRSKNRSLLPPGDTGEYRFVHRIPNNVATEYIDNIPDGALGYVWKPRRAAPPGFYFMKSFGGSLFAGRNDGHPSRVWWSEQDASGAHPESFLSGHWRDVFPETGPITALAQARAATGGDSPFLLVFKELAVHAIHGEYPSWSVGTLPLEAGCAGPGLVRSCPDGTIIWYGNRSFWRFNPKEGSVDDIGTPIKKRLRRVNASQAHMGSSVIDRRSGELIFALPMDDSNRPDVRFVWDYRVQGWRLKDGIEITCMIDIPGMDLILAAGKHAGKEDVWCLDRGYTGYQTPNPTWEYRSGWTPTGEFHNLYNIREAILTMEERHSGTLTLESFKDWDQDTTINSETVTLAHPENNDIPYYGDALYGSSVYRESRSYSARLALDVPSEEVVRIRVYGSDTVSLFAIHGYGPPVALPGGRTPQS